MKNAPIVLIGRDDTLARIAEFVRPPYGAARALVIEGPAGIGKTSLLRAAVSKAADAGATVLSTQPVETDASHAYAALSDLLGTQLDHLARRLPAVQWKALAIALDLSDRPSPPSQDPSQPEASDARTVAAAVLGALRSLAERGPLLLAIDDPDWADRASQDVLSFVLRRASGFGVRVIVTQRAEVPGTAPLGLGDGAGPVAVDRLWLKPLSTSALHRLLRRETEATFPRPTLLRIHELSGGNPLAALQLARTTAATDGRLPPAEDLRLPTSMRDLLGSSLDTLPRTTHRLLLVAALSAKPTTALLAAFLGRDPDRVLRSAVRAGAIRVDGGELHFSHPLYASALVSNAPDRDRRTLHAWLAHSDLEDEEARARHLAFATVGEDSVLARALAAASQRARRRGAPATGAELADLALQRTPPGDPDRSERAVAAAEAWFVAGDTAAARERAERALPWVSGTIRARLLEVLGLVAWHTGTSHQAVALMEAALADAAGESLLAGRLHLYLAIFHDFDLTASDRHAARAAELLEGTDDAGHRAIALHTNFYGSVLLGRQPPIHLLERGLQIENTGPLTDRATSPGMWWAATGSLVRARDRFQNLLDFDILHGEYSNVSNLLTRLAEVELWRDEWSAARSLALSAVEAGLQGGSLMPEPALRVLALVDAHQGNLDEAEAAANEAVARNEAQGSGVLAAAWLQVLALVAATRGDAATVQSVTARAWSHLRAVGYQEPLRLDPSSERVEALVLLGWLPDAELELAAFEARHRRVPKPWAEAAIARCRARLALSRDDLEAALDATLIPDPHATTWSRFDVARLLLIRGEVLRRGRSRREAASALAQARAAFESLGAAAWVERVRADEKRLGLTRSATLELTPTEGLVAQLAAAGLTNAAVAERLGMSPRTVETHLGRVYGKLGVRSRAEFGRLMALQEQA